MKNSNQGKMAKVTMLLFSVLVIFTSGACNKNDGGNGTQAVALTAVVPNLLSASYSGDTQMTMGLYSSGGVASQSGYGYGGYGNNYGGYGNNYGGYSGQYTLTGTMTLNQQNISFCNAPPGAYSLTAVTPVTLQGSYFGQMTLQATGPATIIMSVNYGIMNYNGAGYSTGGTRVSFNMANVTINGQPCGPLVTL